MKYLLFILLTLPFIANASDTTITMSDVYLDAKEGMNQFSNNITELVHQLEGPAEHVYKTYVNEYRIKGLSTIIIVLLGLLLFIIMSIITSIKSDYSKELLINVINIVSGIITMCFIGATIFVFTSYPITEAFNPEYHAIQDIIETIK